MASALQVLFSLCLCLASASARLSDVNTSHATSLAIYEYTTEQPKCAVEFDTEYYGKSFTDVTVHNFSSCCEECQKNDKCKQWTFIRLEAKTKPPGRCYMFRGASVLKQVRTHKDTISGLRWPEKPLEPTFNFEDGYDFKSEINLFETPTPNVHDCATFCAKRLSCKAISYDKRKQICFGKRGMCCKKKNAKVVSALIEKFDLIDLPNKVRHKVKPIPIQNV